MPASQRVDVLALVAPNGLGHFRRQVGILSRLLGRFPGLRIHILCADFQVEGTQDWIRATRLFSDQGVTRTGGILDPGVGWSTDPRRYDNGGLLGWMDRLGPLPELMQSRLVISDNLGGVLAFRRDAVLAGSFLWGDVLAQAYPASEPVRRFAELEAALLAQHRPPMLCVSDVVMPAVLERTEAVPLGWMCEDERSDGPRVEGRPRVGVLGGATGAGNEVLLKAAAALARLNQYELALPASLLKAAGSGVPFRHGPGDYAALSLAVCRPGMGTVTDCVAHGVPMVTLHETPTNPELDHIGGRLRALGLGIDLGSEPSEEGVLQAVAEVLRPPTAARLRSRLDALPRNGLAEAVDFLGARLERTS